MTYEERICLLHDRQYPLTQKYDPHWMVQHAMGSPCLILMESLTRVMDLMPGMRVLDLGCGTAMGSIFLAKEFGVKVFATDLWVSATDNWRRIREAGAEDGVFPIHAEVHALPYAEDFFDAVVCVNSFQFYGYSEFFIGEYVSPLLRPDGLLGLAFYGPETEIGDAPPDYLSGKWWPDFYYFHSLAWVRRLFERTRLFNVETADDLGGDGVRISRLWADVMGKEGKSLDDNGFMRWNRLTARRNNAKAEDFRI